jgi:hypothetical protein
MKFLRTSGEAFPPGLIARVAGPTTGLDHLASYTQVATVSSRGWQWQTWLWDWGLRDSVADWTLDVEKQIPEFWLSRGVSNAVQISLHVTLARRSLSTGTLVMSGERALGPAVRQFFRFQQNAGRTQRKSRKATNQPLSA